MLFTFSLQFCIMLFSYNNSMFFIDWFFNATAAYNRLFLNHFNHTVSFEKRHDRWKYKQQLRPLSQNTKYYFDLTEYLFTKASDTYFIHLLPYCLEELQNLKTPLEYVSNMVSWDLAR